MNRHVNYIVTHDCNLNCLHCYQGGLRSHHGRFASQNDIYDDLNFFWEKGVHSIQFTGGECTTHPSFSNILKFAYNKGFKVSIFTNGQKKIGTDIDYIEHFFMSLDGPKNIHNTIRNSHFAYDNVIDRLKEIREARKKVSLQVSINKLNINCYDELKNILIEYLDIISDVRLIKTINTGNVLKNHSIALQESDIKSIIEIKSRILNDFHYHLSVCDNIYTKQQIKNFCLGSSRQFSLWYDGIVRKFYCFADTIDVSRDLSEYSDESIKTLNDIIKARINNAIEIDKEYYSLDDIIINT